MIQLDFRHKIEEVGEERLGTGVYSMVVTGNPLTSSPTQAWGVHGSVDG